MTPRTRCWYILQPTLPTRMYHCPKSSAILAEIVSLSWYTLSTGRSILSISWTREWFICFQWLLFPHFNPLASLLFIWSVIEIHGLSRHRKIFGHILITHILQRSVLQLVRIFWYNNFSLENTDSPKQTFYGNVLLWLHKAGALKKKNLAPSNDFLLAACKASC